LQGDIDDRATQTPRFFDGLCGHWGAAASGSFTCVEIAKAAAIDVPVVDKLSIRVLVDGSQNLFERPGKVGNVSIEPAPRQKDYRRALHNQWGLSLYLQSQRGNEQRTIMLDFGYTAEALLNNIELTGADPSKINAMVVSHGHFDHLRNRRAGGLSLPSSWGRDFR
jgi:7,8-dihydropterin-6-yl-methyl-4-(beta-D-ribofuranosyl)aminobenzene 5'-phosphate synthase